MPGDRDLWLLLPEPIRRFPPDLGLAIGVAVAVVLLLTSSGPFINSLRVILGLPFVLLLPGYTLVSVLYPDRAVYNDKQNDDETSLSRSHDGIDGIERLSLSIGASIVLTPLVILVLNFTPWGISTGSVVISVGSLSGLMAVVAAFRRRQLPENERFSPSVRGVAHARDTVSEQETTNQALSVLAVVSVLILLGSVSFAVAGPQPAEPFTEFYLLSTNEAGETVAADYPTEFTQGQGRPLLVGIENQEQQTMSYTVVVQLQSIELQLTDGEANTTTVVERRELHRWQPRIEHNETWRQQHMIYPSLTGERLRLAYLLYQDQPSSTVTGEDAYRRLHIWINVTSPVTE